MQRVLITTRLICLGATRGYCILYFTRKRARDEEKREKDKGRQEDGR